MPKQETISVTQFREIAKQERQRNDTATKSKYGNRYVKVDGITFDSKKESIYYGRLKLRVKSKDILRFDMHTVFDLKVNGILISKYEVDFIEYFPDGRVQYIDVKSDWTRNIAAYKMKKRLMKAIHNIEIIEK